MTETIKTCRNCKYYKDYEDVFDWISSRIFGFPTLQKCSHPDRWKNIDYVNGTVSPYTLCSIERCTGSCGRIGKNWEARK